MFSFEKIPQAKFKSKGAIIAERILSDIKSGEYSSGSKLPSERTIAEQIGVSRPSVREAISALQIVGIIESQPGDGNYITENLIIDDLSLRVKNILEESESPYDILQARKVVEIGSVRMAIREATDEDIQAVVETLKGDWLTQGPKIGEFEKAFAEYVGAKYAVAVSNGTA